MFITFEGIEGSGKTTQIKLLAKALTDAGRDVVVTREPGGTVIGDQIRAILLDAKNKKMVASCELLLYYAARAQHLEELILPSLNAGRIVISDRFVDATVAYQSFARGIDPRILDDLNQIVLKGFRADLSFLFDMPVSEGLARARKRAAELAQGEREDRFEKEALSFHEAVRAGYLKIARKDPERFHIVDATRDVQALHQEIFALVSKRLA